MILCCLPAVKVWFFLIKAKGRSNPNLPCLKITFTTSPALTSLDLRQQLAILVVGQINGLGRTGRGAHPAAETQGFLNFRPMFLIHMRDAVRATAHTDEAADAPVRIHVRDDGAFNLGRVGQEGPGSRRGCQGLGDRFIHRLRAVGQAAQIYPLRRAIHRPQFRMRFHQKPGRIALDRQERLQILNIRRGLPRCLK